MSNFIKICSRKAVIEFSIRADSKIVWLFFNFERYETDIIAFKLFGRVPKPI